MNSIEEAVSALLIKIRSAFSGGNMPEVKIGDPKKADGDITICLLDINTSDISQNYTHISEYKDNKLYDYSPGKAVTLLFMIFTGGESDIEGVSYLNNFSLLTNVIASIYKEPFLKSVPDDSESVSCYFSALSFDEKLRIWQSFSVKLQNAVYLNVGPIEIGGEGYVYNDNYSKTFTANLKYKGEK
jgi:hypothetical protein